MRNKTSIPNPTYFFLILIIYINMNRIFEAGKSCGATWLTRASFARLVSLAISVILLIIVAAWPGELPKVIGLPTGIILVGLAITSGLLSLWGDARTGWCAGKEMVQKRG